MSRLNDAFKSGKALVAYFTAGDPDCAKSKEILLAACRAGIDVLELGVPFSDPTSDGPVIQEASIRALKNGMTLAGSLALAKSLRAEVDTPIVLFGYYNPILRYGANRFYQEALDAGIDGLLVVDLPPEESDELTRAFDDPAKLPLIRLIAPTTPVERQKEVAQNADGFIYLISRTGVTGVGGLDVEAIAEHARETRKVASVPVCVGFGISTPADVRALAPFVDGVVIGSALVKLALQSGDNAPQAVAAAVQDLKQAIL
jgi:tryptophan synthase alpha chain